jgi:MSHA biogenesis protein MshI
VGHGRRFGEGKLLSLLKKTQNSGWRAGVMPGDRDTALAIVRTRKGQRPLLRHCAAHPLIEIRPEHVLMPLNQRELLHASVSGVIRSEDYQLLQVEAPEVQPDEMRSAVRWKVRDVVDFPIHDAVIDVFETPDQSRYVQSRMMFVVAARGDAVQRVAGLIKPRVRNFDAIDIPELCLRNLSALLPQDERGVALLALGDNFAQLVLTRQGTLYLTRRIELGRRRDLDLQGNNAGLDVHALALELQRSLDYYESHFDQPPIADLVIASGDERADHLVDALRGEIGVSAEPFDVQDLFEVAPGVEPDTHWSALIAMGAALRPERGSS